MLLKKQNIFLKNQSLFNIHVPEIFGHYSYKQK